MSYTDKTAVQNYILQNIDNTFDTQVTEWITGVELFMDGYCGCKLVEESSTPTTRVYDGNGSQELKISDAYDISAVEVDGTVVTPYLYPANSDRKYLLRLTTDVFPIGMQNVSVTGIFGRFKTVPADIKFAATVFVAGIVNQSNKQSDGIQSEKVGEYQVVYRSEKERADYARACQILDTYRKVAF